MKTHRSNISSSKNKTLNNKLCADCYKCGIRAYKGSNIELLKLSDFYSNNHKNEINLILKKQTD